MSAAEPISVKLWFDRIAVSAASRTSFRNSRFDKSLCQSLCGKVQSPKYSNYAQTIDLLTVCEWQGNVRELCNEIRRIVARAEDHSIITPDEFSPALRLVSPPLTKSPVTAGFFYSDLSMPETIDKLEKEMNFGALSKNNHKISRSARGLGITRRGLQLKLARFEIREK